VGEQGIDAWAGESRRWLAVTKNEVLRRRQREPGAEQGSGGARRKKGEELS
jgi:hypothetical protein